jgi:hypothetical protein
MTIKLKTSDVGLQDFQRSLDAAWREVASQDRDAILAEYPEAADALDADSIVHAERTEEGYGAVELIMIAVAARLVSTLPERVMVNIFDTYIWPKLKDRFGGDVERSED